MQEKNCVFAIIPAAGRSRRMGSPKQLLDIDGRTMLQAVVEPLLASEIRGVLIVTHSGLEDSIRAMFADTRIGIAINDDENSEMIDSIRIGLRTWRERESISERDGFLVCPGDHPGITAVDFDACIATFRANPDRIVVAMRDGKRGHPMIFPNADASLVQSNVCDSGLNCLVRSNPARIAFVDCQSPSVIMDIDTPTDLNNHYPAIGIVPPIDLAPHLKARPIRRLGLAAVFLLAVLGLVRGIWGYLAQNRLDRAVASARDAARSISVADFDAEWDAIPAALNAALLYEDAEAEVVDTTASGVLSLTNFADKPELFSSDAASAQELIDSNAHVFELVKDAKKLPQVAWSSRLGPGVQFTGTSHRKLARLLHFAATYHFRAGDHQRAIAFVDDGLRFAEAIEAHPTIIDELVAWACRGLSCSSITDFGGTLQVAVAIGTSDNKSRPATREQVDQLIQHLVNDGSMQEHAVRSCRGEQALILQNLEEADYFDCRVTGGAGVVCATPVRQVVGFLIKPLITLEASRQVEHANIAAVAFSEGSWPAANEHFPNIEGVSPGLLYELSHPMTYSMFGKQYDSRRRSVVLLHKSSAIRRMSACALAIRLFEIENGKRPNDLKELVPSYLDELPTDPFAEDGEIFHYRPEADRPMLYSVGENGIDDDGVDFRMIENRVERPDIAFYLVPKASD